VLSIAEIAKRASDQIEMRLDRLNVGYFLTDICGVPLHQTLFMTVGTEAAQIPELRMLSGSPQEQ
jgi:hypothetical protein